MGPTVGHLSCPFSSYCIVLSPVSNWFCDSCNSGDTLCKSLSVILLHSYTRICFRLGCIFWIVGYLNGIVIFVPCCLLALWLSPSDFCQVM